MISCMIVYAFSTEQSAASQAKFLKFCICMLPTHKSRIIEGTFIFQFWKLRFFLPNVYNLKSRV